MLVPVLSALVYFCMQVFFQGGLTGGLWWYGGELLLVSFLLSFFYLIDFYYYFKEPSSVLCSFLIGTLGGLVGVFFSRWTTARLWAWGSMLRVVLLGEFLRFFIIPSVLYYLFMITIAPWLTKFPFVAPEFFFDTRNFYAVVFLWVVLGLLFPVDSGLFFLFFWAAENTKYFGLCFFMKMVLLFLRWLFARNDFEVNPAFWRLSLDRLRQFINTDFPFEELLLQALGCQSRIESFASSLKNYLDQNPWKTYTFNRGIKKMFVWCQGTVLCFVPEDEACVREETVAVLGDGPVLEVIGTEYVESLQEIEEAPAALLQECSVASLRYTGIPQSVQIPNI